jgi:hydroxymethylbilane synthase
MRLRIASRTSDLARIQAYQVARALKAIDPSISVEHEFRSSLGDQNLDVPLSSWESKGVFTQDFFEDLKANKFDMVVHSWKDLPTEARVGTAVVATLPRADVRDLLLIPKSVWAEAKEQLTLLSSSPRRSFNLRNFAEYFPKKLKLEFKNVRGNVPTRIEKMFSEKAGLILAKAGLDRLLEAPEPEFASMQTKLRERLSDCIFMVLPLEILPPAAAQGALAVEINSENKVAANLLAKINHPETFSSVEWERQTLKSHGGGCHQKIGVVSLSKLYGRLKLLKGVTEAGDTLDETIWESYQTPLPPAESAQKVFPFSPSENKWFDRKRLPVETLDASALWVARAEAWPDGFSYDGVVWTSGLQSWKKLASLGVWVNGCAEGLGEENTRLETLRPGLAWVKLTHKCALEYAKGKASATYELTDKAPDVSPSLRDKTHFYWMSASSFKRALELFPRELKNGYHGCGPGITYHFLTRQNLLNPPKIFLNHEAFLSEVLPP